MSKLEVGEREVDKTAFRVVELIKMLSVMPAW